MTQPKWKVLEELPDFICRILCVCGVCDYTWSGGGHMLEKLLALRKFLIDRTQMIPLPRTLPHSLDVKRLGNLAQSFKGPGHSKA